jgi:DNA-3-methyladenine glycosylase II
VIRATLSGVAVGEPRTNGLLQAVAPFDLIKSIRFLEGFGPCKGEQCTTETSLTKAIALDGHDIVFRATATPDPTVVAYELFAAAPIPADVIERAATAISDYFSMRDDLAEFSARAEQDHENYAFITRALRGLHQVRFLTVSEIACWSVLSQRSYKSVALAAKHRLMDRFGHRVEVENAVYQAFPTTDELVTLRVEEWDTLVRNARKAATLVSLVAAIEEVGEDFLRTAPYEDAEAALRAVRGVGEWTAAAILLRGLGRMDECPISMDSFVKVAVEVYGPDVDLAAIKTHYGPQIGYWAYYLHSGMGALKAHLADCS